MALGAVGALALAGAARRGAAAKPVGDVDRGRALLRSFRIQMPDLKASEEDSLARYEALWSRGHADSVTKMSGYRKDGPHQGVVAQLERWQPGLKWFDLIVLNSSGGKDSMAMLIVLKALARLEGIEDRLQVVHADLGEAEHPEVRELAEEQARLLGLPFSALSRNVYGVDKTLLERFIENVQDKFLVAPRSAVDQAALKKLGFAARADTDEDKVWVLYAPAAGRAELQRRLLQLGLAQKDNAKGNPGLGQFQLRVAGGFPGFGTRYCTSEFKTGEVSKWVSGQVASLKLGRPARVLNVLGLRAEESEKRAGPGFEAKGPDTRSKITREWLPIQLLKESDVWDLIAASGLPYHAAYDVGFHRLSCRLCPLAGDEDVALAALTYPKLTKRILDIEDTYGFKFKEKRGLREIITEGVRRNPDLPRLAKLASARLPE